MRAYLIDPGAKEVTEVDYNGDYRHIYEHIDATLFDAVPINKFGDVVYVDDEGLLGKRLPLFTLRTYHQELAGKGLVLGTNGEGGSVPPHISLDDLRDMVVFQ